MAIGFSSDSSNGGNSGHDDGSLTVAQIRAPSTPFSSDTDPFNDFHFSGREDVVTVKDVEEIVEAVKSSFAKFIEVQRSYLDRQQSSDSSSTDSSESKNSSSAESTQTSSQPSNSVENFDEDGSLSNGLTEAAVSDIIEAVSKKNDLINAEIQDSIVDLKNGITSKLDSISNEISEKLIESSSENEDRNQKNQPSLTAANSSMEISANDMFMSFVEFMTGSNERIENKIDGFQESLNLIINNQKNIENSAFSSNKKNAFADSQSTISTEVNTVDIVGQENKGISGHDNDIEENVQNTHENESLVSKIGDYFDSLFSDIDKIFFSNDLSNEENNKSQSLTYSESSLSDVVNENNRLIKILKTDIDGMSKSIGIISNDGIAKSMVEMMVQNSMIQMVASNTVEGMTSIMSKRIDEKFGDIIRTINESNKASLTDKTSDNKVSSFTDSNSVISKNDESSEQSANDGSIKTGKPETVDISKNGESAILNKSETSGSQSPSVGNGVDSNSKKESEKHSYSGEAESKKNGIFGFIEDAFDNFISLFKTETTKKDENSKIVNSSNSVSFSKPKTEETILQPTVVAPVVEYSSSESKNTSSIKTEISKEDLKSSISTNLGVYSDSESLEKAIQRAGLNNENVLRILDESYSDSEALLANFQELVDGFKKNDSEVEGATQLGNVNAQDLLNYYLSGRESRIEEMNRMNAAIAAASAEKEKKEQSGIGESSNSSKKSANENEKETSDGNTVEKVLENRKIMIERFDRLETSLQSSSSSMPSTQTIYMPMPDNRFEVDRIG